MRVIIRGEGWDWDWDWGRWRVGVKVCDFEESKTGWDEFGAGFSGWLEGILGNGELGYY